MASEKPTVLLAEDEESVRSLLSRAFEKQGFNVIEAEDGEVAKEHYLNDKEGKIAVIHSDLRMPKMDGIELAEFNYKKRFIPFIACTSVTDAKIALDLLRFGVQDYIVKPLRKSNVSWRLKNAINRRLTARPESKGGEHYAGNVGALTVNSKLEELQEVSYWIRKRAKEIITNGEANRFINYVGEFILNAHEHGNLKIGEEKKSKLLRIGQFDNEVALRELTCDKTISIGMSIIEDEIALSITDSGDGFDFNKYIYMTEDNLFERLERPNGLAIHMCTKYFDSITYSKDGASVLLRKKTTSA
jgi:DNA-binding response OmpR family regulator